MVLYHGSITDQSGHSIAINGIEVWLTINAHSWEGRCSLPLDAIVQPGAYQLTLDDGKTGEIVVERVHHSTSGEHFGIFAGNGPPPA